jgi:hypothetical protein
MFFLNLTAGEFIAFLGGLGGLITALYLLDRAKRRKVVSTLRFWTSAMSAEERQARRRMREPWSLILQLASLLLLLLAIAQLEWGSRQGAGRKHVLLLDTSAWAGAVGADGSAVIERERKLASAYLARVPERDQVMVVLADALATPVTPFTADRGRLNEALRGARPGYSALNIDEALSYGEQAQSWSGGERGEIVYAGPGKIAGEETLRPRVSKLRVLPVPCECEDAGIVRASLKRNPGTGGEWQATIAVKNHGKRHQSVRLNARFGNTAFTARRLSLAPLQEVVADYVFVTDRGGQFEAELEAHDALASDNRVTLAMPRTALLRVAAYTNRAETLRPLIEANPLISAAYFSPSQYRQKPVADVVLFDQMAPSSLPGVPSLWIQPPRTGSPLPVNDVVGKAVVTTWNSNSTLAAGLHAKETQLSAAEIFHTFEGDIPVANVSEGPIVVARPASTARPKLAVIGFDPLEGDMKFQVTTPLLFANLLRWLSPEAVRSVEVSAGRVGATNVAVDASDRPNEIQVSTDKGDAIPFTIGDGTLQLFTAEPRIVRISSNDRERLLSLTLPQIAEQTWNPSAASASGVPRETNFASSSVSLWQWLAVLAAASLIIEWVLFGLRRSFHRRRLSIRNAAGTTMREKAIRELVSR